MYSHMSGWAWLWMTTVWLAWVGLIGLVLYLVFKLAKGHSGKPHRPAGG
jgi:hypothetical protein